MKLRRQPHPPTPNIAFVCFSQARGGLELMLVTIARLLLNRGTNVLFVSPDESPIHKECAKNGIPHEAVTPIMKYADPASGLKLARLFKRYRIRLVMIGRSHDVSTVALASLVSSVKLVFFQQMQSGIKKKDVFHRWIYSRLDRWLTLTHAMKQSVLATTTVPAHKINVISFGTDLSVFDPKRYHPGTMRKKYHIPANRRLVALIGRFDTQKGHEYLLNAAPTILKRVPRSHFLFVGEETRGQSGFVDHLKDLVRFHRLGNHVQFLPFTSRVAELLSTLDVVVMPSFSETYGYLAIESMAMGVPVVGTKAGGLPEIVVHGRTGYLVPPKNSSELADKIIKLLKDKRLHQRMSRHSRSKAKEVFNLDDQISNLLTLFSTIAA